MGVEMVDVMRYAVVTQTCWSKPCSSSAIVFIAVPTTAGTGSEATHIAILSANAFNKELDNDAGIAADDFLVKPLRVEEFLDWIGRKLDLEWVSAESPIIAQPSAPHRSAALVPPGQSYLSELDELVSLGYVRGILNKLGEIERLEPDCGEFVKVLRELARRFQFEAMQEVLRKAHDAT